MEQCRVQATNGQTYQLFYKKKIFQKGMTSFGCLQDVQMKHFSVILTTAERYTEEKKKGDQSDLKRARR